MLCLLTVDSAIIDGITHARWRMADILKVSPADITAALRAVDLRIDRGVGVNFDVNPDSIEGVSLEDAREVMLNVWNNESKPLLEERLKGIRDRRGYKREYDAS